MRLLATSLLALAAACGGRSHHHGTPMEGDPGKLYLEVTAGGSHAGALRAGAESALSRMSFAVPVDDRGQVELEARVDEVAESGDDTTCKVKVMVLRLPNDSLLGLADGSARARGTGGEAADACVERLVATLIQGKIRALLRRELRDRR